MQKGIKIFVGIIALLGLLSVIFLLTSKKKTANNVKNAKTEEVQKQSAPAPAPAPKIATPTAPKSETATAPASTPKPEAPVQKKQDPKVLAAGQWQQCKNKTLPASQNVNWIVKIFEAIPAGGTYAKGSLNGDAALPVRVIIKSDSQIKDKISGMLVVGKNAFLRGNCTEVATDGAVVLQAF